MSIAPPEITALDPNFSFTFRLAPILPPVPQTPNEVVSDEISHFDYPGSDIVLRSWDTFDFPLPKLNIVICSPPLRNLIERVSNTFDVPFGEERQPLPVVELPESKENLYSLLTFIFPVTPVLPPTAEKIMELLAVAQKYEMNSVMSHIRGAISRQGPPFLRPETAFHVYLLAQQHGLHQEALQAARLTLRFPMTIEDLKDKLDFPGPTGAYLHELWKYHKKVRTQLKPAVLAFRNSGLPDDVKILMCTRPSHGGSSPPQWLYEYINSIAGTPHLFDHIGFETAWARHVQSYSASYGACSCVGISSQVIRSFWDSLTDVVHRTIEKADSTFTLVKEEPTSENSDTPSASLCLDMPEASIIVRSSDQENFRVQKSVLAMSSPFFRDLLSLPQPSDGELVDGLPVIALPEDAGLLSSLISLLYPISPIIPDSYQKVLALLAVCQKYEMESVQSIIRALIKVGTFPAPGKDESFNAYAIASSLGLDPEAEDAARLTLGQPMTFKSLGEGLRSFKGRALCDLIRYRDTRGKNPKPSSGWS